MTETMKTVEERLGDSLSRAIAAAYPDLGPEAPRPEVAVPREEGFGDYSSNIAMGLARLLKRPPRQVAETLAGMLGTLSDPLVGQATVAGPGFLNVTLSREALAGAVADVLRAGATYGRSARGGGRRYQVEFVSANPTGPLNVVNARAAAFGGALARLFNAAGYDCRTEFYVNDVGTQIDLLGESFMARHAEAQGGGPAVIPENGYRGEYLLDLARGLSAADFGPGGAAAASAADFSRLAVRRILAWQEGDLRNYGTTYDRWYLQSELYPDAVEATRKKLIAAGFTVENEGAFWLATTRFGDDQDRVLVRSNGEPTYFLADIAYHWGKHERGFEHVIDIWGPDHHGHIPRMQAAMQVMGLPAGFLEVIIVQQVNLLSGGEPVKMSKRAGEFITLDDLVRDVGKDTALFFFLMRRANSHLDFDMDLARSTSDENPVYYVKYAHARISGILRRARDEGMEPPDGTADLSRLEHPAERALMRQLLQFPDLIQGAAEAREPHRLTTYLRTLAATFHPFYHQCRVLGEEAGVAAARLALCEATRRVLANGLALMTIDAPESM